MDTHKQNIKYLKALLKISWGQNEKTIQAIEAGVEALQEQEKMVHCFYCQYRSFGGSEDSVCGYDEEHMRPVKLTDFCSWGKGEK